MPDPGAAPDEGLLRRFLLGELSGPELESVAAYLDRNPRVAATLQSLKVRDTLLDALRAGDAGADSPAVVALVARITDLSAQPAEGTTPPGPDGSTVTAAAPPAAASAADTAASKLRTDPDDDVLTVLAPSEHPGDLGRLGRYRVLRVLGRGGMGVVFEAEDDKLKRRVALKAMLPGLAATAAARRRFVREAETAAKVEHDNIVPIYDIADADGVPFLAMPLLVGGTLDDRLKPRAPLPAADVVLIGRQVAEGLAAAHAAGLIHRDIKPGNVWLERTPGGAFRRARILDFGLARSVRDGAGLTHSGAVMGTPAYMAPEQARGHAVDHRADLFSLGCVLYQMATGRRPFQGDDTLAVLAALATDTPPAPARVNPAVPPALSVLIGRLLSKNADERWPATARAVADELARLEKPADAAPPPAPRRRRPWALAACAVLAAAVGLAGYLYGGTVVRVVTDKGELVIEVDDPNIEVKVVRGDAVLVDKTKNREFVLKAGDGEVIFFDPVSEVTTVARKFELKRGDAVRVRATVAELAAKRPPPPPQPVPAPADPRAPVPPKVEPAGLFVAGSVWRGVKMIDTGVFAGMSTVYALHVETRDGEKFTGHVNDNGPNRNPATVTGTVRGTAIEWKEVPLNNANHHTAVRATRAGTVLAGDTIGRFPPGQGNTGRAVLYRVPRSGEPVPADFVPAFDNRRLRDWEAHSAQPGKWEVNQFGKLVVSADAVTHLYTARDDYDDVHVRVRAKVSAGGTGALFVRAGYGPAAGGALPAGYKAQIEGGSRPERTGALFTAPNKSVPAAGQGPPAEEWFDLEVIAVGGTVRVLVDGKETARAEGLTAHAKGRIALQAGAKTTIEVAAIAVKELTPRAGARPAGRPEFANAGTWVARGDELVQTTADTAQPMGPMLLFGDPAWTDYDFTCEARVESGKEGFKVVFRAADPDNLYGVGFGSYGNAWHDVWTLEDGMWKRDVGRGFGLSPGSIKRDQWHRVRVSVRGPAVEVFLDGKRVFALVDNLYPAGRVGLSTWGGSVRFRDLKVTAPEGRVLFSGPPPLPPPPLPPPTIAPAPRLKPGPVPRKNDKSGS
jgi:hypothetical protein